MAPQKEWAFVFTPDELTLYALRLRLCAMLSALCEKLIAIERVRVD